MYLPQRNALPPLTPTQRKILQFVRTYRAVHFVGPSTDEISHHIGKCKSNTFRYVHVLLDKGLLHASFNTDRVRVGSLHVPADVCARLPQE